MGGILNSSSLKIDSISTFDIFDKIQYIQYTGGRTVTTGSIFKIDMQHWWIQSRDDDKIYAIRQHFPYF